LPNDIRNRLEKIHDEILTCARCPLHQSRRHAVPGEGDLQANVMIIGEAPGTQEDKQGRPFVGQAGRMLNKLLEACGIDRQRTFITNSVKCRPPENRKPHRGELAICKANWLDRQIAWIDPKVVILLGKTPLEQVLEVAPPLRDLHGQTLKRNGRRFVPMYHPAAGLPSPQVRQTMREDLQKLGQILPALAR